MQPNSPPDRTVTYTSETSDIDWHALKIALAADRFDNGRSPEQLRRSFQNSFAVCIAHVEGRVVGTARVLSDGVCNAYLIDVWTHSLFRRCGIAMEMIRRLCSRLTGQHMYLQVDVDLAEVYHRLGFRDQPVGMALNVGQWLINDA